MVEKALRKALSRLILFMKIAKLLIFKHEQEAAVNNLLHGRDVMAFCTKDFGKIMIFNDILPA